MAHVGWMPQDPRLPGSVRLIDFVSYAAWLKGLTWTRAVTAARASLAAVDLVDRSADRIKSLSGGMQRRAAFAAACVHRPKLLVLDEPMSGLDPEQRSELRALIWSYSRSACVLLSTHILQDLPELADWVLVMTHGRVRFDDSYNAFVGEGGSSTNHDLEQAYLRAAAAEDGGSSLQ